MVMKPKNYKMFHMGFVQRNQIWGGNLFSFITWTALQIRDKKCKIPYIENAAAFTIHAFYNRFNSSYFPSRNWCRWHFHPYKKCQIWFDNLQNTGFVCIVNKACSVHTTPLWLAAGSGEGLGRVLQKWHGADARFASDAIHKTRLNARKIKRRAI